MKISLNRLHIAVAIAVVALVVVALPATSFAATSDYWPPYPTPYGSSYGCYHVVHYGDTMSSVAGYYGTSVYGLMQMNGMYYHTYVYPGMVMHVPCAPAGYPHPVPYSYPNPYSHPYTYPTQCVTTVYTVQPGDTLYGIARRYGVSPYTLAYTNRLYNPNLIYAWMPMVIPCSMGYSYPSQPYPPHGYPPQPYPTQIYPVPYPTAISPTPAPITTPPPTGQVMVVMRNIAFNPPGITIRVGQTVVWQNQDTAPHTTTSGTCPGGVCTPMPGWDSGTLNPGQSFSHTFTTAGTFPYFCRIHGAMMQGSVVVMP